ncbi:MULTISPECIES: bifunctional (p)ppGpp synthetase/guanosine-3',5'-bis(diphosphate) 3'-pyrophosphohydrolase [Megasphaera]|jgi:guanosine-3',5'-bis(diphosphate) 3'-pyrophosphohydrolase|uniref:GTP diphosphokinase n=7 Tax=Megasphaera TaxID=906 RepID=A0ABV1CW50_9FIRM|nr:MULTISPECIES: bifunctional (p)ppGpp synthetase/guanosine-3',5'-bis(diphosphate) 3'-pyrophosphohydrolase [unclassified Megasphaera]MCH3903264.1 bifunctional (p)ppGpp synthetase/guanosine-3',5'-bis(diphosphate) 3'-pyrophosphohydrolase [Limosilactobacillus oris]MCI1887897.1 bifunctional (p)ppGpp synthetase/guanosine-3',5'-bis(diphosphate) 3'-pyrophosphohydrolase [Sporolactobacillus sp.]MCI1905767.1 bifunctional (p)ppGpp synthetase/guanosine-3',5'-bis(diphosphate) 3'-pyrophosphohydrolase [Enteroc
MEFKDKDVEFKHLIDTIHTYLPQAKCDDVTKAYNLAEEAHKDQRRVSGEPYILHPLAVAQILADMKIDTTTITASLLHDVVEDTSYTLEDIKKMFGKEVAFLVDGVTKLSRLNYRTKEDQQLNSMRKMFLAMAKDVRVVVIKLADRLHNMRTLRYMRSDKQKRIAQETLEIFAPLAHRLGIFNIKWELEDLSFRYLEPDKYYDLVDQMKQKRHVREEIVNEAIDVLKKALDEAHIHCEINGRPKHFYSIYKKMKKDNRDLSQVYDLFAIRVIVDDVKDCYGVLGIVHSLWKPLPYRFKDYIAMPKPNNYQSLHTTVIGTRGQPVEIQIRTWEMHRIAEYGVAAHWRYKEGNQTANKDAFDEKMGWLRNLLEWQDTSNPKEFVNALKLDAFSDEVFVFSPRGDVIDLPQGSIPIDFAYRIHTDVGHRCVGAKINGKIVPLDYKLKNGDIVEIITSKVGKPSLDWLNIVGSSESRSKIRSWFKKENREENIAKGLDALERECKRLGHDWKALNVGGRLGRVAKQMNAGSEDDLVAAVGYGGFAVNTVLIKLLELHKKDLQKQEEKTNSLAALEKLKTKKPVKHNGTGILVKGEPGLLVRLAKCCSPVPGDPIIGFITRGRGVSVHRADCPNVTHGQNDVDRLIDVEWDYDGNERFEVNMEIVAYDRTGIMAEIMATLAEMKISILSVNAKTSDTKNVTIHMGISIKDLAQFEFVATKIRRLKDVYAVERYTGGSQT